MTTNFKITLEYDGAAYHGWQRQKTDRTIQGELERALGMMTGQSVVVHGSGRTDAGVHALAQTASFKCHTRIPPDKLRNGLNAILGGDIVAHDCRAMPPEFHARFNAIGKRYRYQIRNHPLPAAIGRQYHWHVRAPLDIEAMNRGAECLVGTHDFKSFEGAGSPRADTTRHVHLARWRAVGGDLLFFEIEANGFLRFMVRNIVGTLVAVGLGKMAASEVAAIRDARDRGRAAATAPAAGLFLEWVRYPDSDSDSV